MFQSNELSSTVGSSSAELSAELLSENENQHRPDREAIAAFERHVTGRILPPFLTIRVSSSPYPDWYSQHEKELHHGMDRERTGCPFSTSAVHWPYKLHSSPYKPSRLHKTPHEHLCIALARYTNCARLLIKSQVGAGATWGDVVQATAAQGYRPKGATATKVILMLVVVSETKVAETSIWKILSWQMKV